MASTIKLKNGTGIPLVGDLVQGEPAFDLTNKRLYTENAGGVVIEVGTNPSTLSVTGAATFASTVSAVGESKVYRSGVPAQYMTTTVGGGETVFNAANTDSATRGIYRWEATNNVNTAAHMTLDASGNLGIGVVPNGAYSKLQVKAAATSYVADFIGNASGDSQLTFWNSNQTAVVSYIENQDAGAHMSIVAGSGRSLKLGAGGTAGQVLLDASGNLGLGATPSAWTAGWQAMDIKGGSFVSGGVADARVYANAYYNGTNHIYKADGFANSYIQAGGAHTWFNAPSGTESANITFTQAMTLDASGNLLVGTTGGSFGARITAESSTSYTFESFRTGTASSGHIAFKNGNGAVGSIFTNGTATAYNTSSDERLKENITDANEAGDKIDAIKVRQYDWKADGSHQDYGMVAQELMTVAPEAVYQPEDPKEMMGIDYSKLVPMLLKEIQSLRSRLDAAGL